MPGCSFLTRCLHVLGSFPLQRVDLGTPYITRRNRCAVRSQSDPTQTGSRYFQSAETHHVFHLAVFDPDTAPVDARIVLKVDVLAIRRPTRPTCPDRGQLRPRLRFDGVKPKPEPGPQRGDLAPVRRPAGGPQSLRTGQFRHPFCLYIHELQRQPLLFAD